MAHPERGLLAPGEFIEVAEDTGLILAIGDWVFGEACRQASPGADDRSTICGSTLGPPAAQPGSIVIAPSTRRTPARGLCLELTETAVMGDVERCRSVLEELHALGLQLAIDDFGTGYSSLSYLRVRVDRLKIDRSFMAELAERPAEQTMVSSMIGRHGAWGFPSPRRGLRRPSSSRRCARWDATPRKASCWRAPPRPRTSPRCCTSRSAHFCVFVTRLRLVRWPSHASSSRVAISGGRSPSQHRP